jgi:hypothetical protein
MITIEYMKRKQKQLEKKWAKEAKLEAEKEAQRVAKIKAEADAQKEIAARKKLFLEQQEDKRLRQKFIQRKEKLQEQKWNEQFNALFAKVESLQRESDKLEEIRTIIENREPSLQELDWDMWLSDPLNQRLADLDFERAMEMFKRDNLMAKRRHRTRGRPRKVEPNYFLSFTGDTNTDTRKGDLVATDFNPDDFSLATKGFTISYWVRPDELGGDMFAIGRKAHNNARFTFGISSRTKGYFGVGSNQSERSWEIMLDTAGIDKATHLTQDGDDWILKIGTWYHFAITYAGTDAGTNKMLRKIYMNGQQIWGTGVSDPDNKGNINWSDTGREMNHGLSFGMRAVRGSGTSTSYNNGWACGLDEVAIYNKEKNADWVASVYDGGTSYNHKNLGGSGLVGYWRFNEGNGRIAKDLSGNKNHGLLTNDSHGDDGGAAFATGTPGWNKTPKGYDRQ